MICRSISRTSDPHCFRRLRRSVTDGFGAEGHTGVKNNCSSWKHLTAPQLNQNFQACSRAAEGNGNARRLISEPRRNQIANSNDAGHWTLVPLFSIVNNHYCPKSHLLSDQVSLKLRFIVIAFVPQAQRESSLVGRPES